MNYVIATIEGLHLTCDFCVYSAALYGCPPNYSPTPTGLHEAFREPYKVLGGMPFNAYDQLALISCLDLKTLEAIQRLPPGQSLKNFTCLAFEIERDELNIKNPTDSEMVLEKLLDRGERILDTIRLFLFKPGEDRSIGRVGAIGNGVRGIWYGDEDQNTFIARKLDHFQFVQNPMSVSLKEVREIYNDPVFKELHSASCSTPEDDDPLLRRIFECLRSLRTSREIQDPKVRFLELSRIAEYLGKRTETEQIKGTTLRDRVAKIASKGSCPNVCDSLSVSDLWSNVRNPLTHSAKTFSGIGRDSGIEIPKMEQLVLEMLKAVTIAWRNEQFGIEPYDALLHPDGA